MSEIFKAYLKNKSELEDADIERILATTQLKKLRKHQYLLQQGDVWKYNAFVNEGCLRTYSVDEKGNEHIIQFSIEEWWAGDRASYESGEPSLFNIETLEASEVLLISKTNLEQLCKQIPAFNDLINNILHRSFIAAQGRIHTSISLSAEEKYNQFIRKYPQIANRVSQGMIASYLGITPETLSRVRKRTGKH